MEEVEDLPVETVYNLIHANVMSLEEFIEWVNHEKRESFMDGTYHSQEYE